MADYKISEARLVELETAARRVLAIVAAIRRTKPATKAKRLSLVGETFGDRLVAARKSRKIKQFELASRAAMSPAQLCQLEHGNVVPSIVMAERLANALGVDVADLIG